MAEYRMQQVQLVPPCRLEYRLTYNPCQGLMTGGWWFMGWHSATASSYDLKVRLRDREPLVRSPS